ncbi:alcohol dehydrogenase [Actinomadura cremea]|nr:alcohol dehydrogenase [Actinomadura cremea]
MVAEQERGPIGRRAVLSGAAVAAGVAGMAMAAGPAAAAPPPRPGRRYAGKTVLITGATSGIGRAAAIAFAKEGARVGFCGRRERLGREVEREIRRAGGEAVYVRADVRDPGQLKGFIDGIARRYGGLDVALNNAGIQTMKPITEQTLEEFDDTLTTNTRAVWLSIKYEIAHMGAGGVILVTGSTNEFVSRPGLSSYAASKGGVSGIVRSAALELGPKIRVVSLSPGTTDTAIVDAQRAFYPPMSDADWERQKGEWGKANVDAMKRMARPEDMAGAALALASPDMAFQTGVSVVVDGGQLAGL